MTRPSPCIGCGVELDDTGALRVAPNAPIICSDGRLGLAIGEGLHLNGFNQLAVIPTVPGPDTAYLRHYEVGEYGFTVPGSLGGSGVFTPGVGAVSSVIAPGSGGSISNPSSSTNTIIKLSGSADCFVYPSTGTDGAGALSVFASIDGGVNFHPQPFFRSVFTSTAGGTQFAVCSQPMPLFWTIPPGYFGTLAIVYTYSNYGGAAANLVRSTAAQADLEYHWQ